MAERGGTSGGPPGLAVANVVAFALLVGSGLVHGRLTDRWGTSEELARAIARLDRVPRSIGDWQGRDAELDRRQIERAGIQGYLSRSYRNARDGREASILLVCGRPGPIAVHTPDVCYKGAGYEAEAEPVVEALVTDGGRPAHFLKARFHKAGAIVPDTLDILWAWNARGPWEVPANPRVAFATHPYLYKIYLIARRDGPSPSPAGGPSGDREPAGALLEAIDRVLSGVPPPG